MTIIMTITMKIIIAMYFLLVTLRLEGHYLCFTDEETKPQRG